MCTSRRCFLRISFSTVSWIYLIILPSTLVISWLPLLPILVQHGVHSERGRIRCLVYSQCFSCFESAGCYILRYFREIYFGPESDIRHVDITYFSFRSVVSATTVYSRSLVNMLSNLFLLLRVVPYSVKSLLQLVWVTRYRFDFLSLDEVTCVVCFFFFPWALEF